MKTVITSSGDQIEATMDPRFGRAEWFCIYDHESKETNFIKNENLDANSGAGTKTAELMTELNITEVISGRFGPKAKTLLEQLSIRLITIDNENSTVEDIIEKIKNKAL